MTRSTVWLDFEDQLVHFDLEDKLEKALAEDNVTLEEFLGEESADYVIFDHEGDTTWPPSLTDVLNVVDGEDKCTELFMSEANDLCDDDAFLDECQSAVDKLCALAKTKSNVRWGFYHYEYSFNLFILYDD